MTMWNQMADTHVVAYLNGVATDITRYVLVPPRGGQINSARGRQTELAQMDPSRMSLVLENRDGRFTPGNPSSPYYPYWRQGVRMVWTETLGARTFTHFDGPLEIPEVQLNYQAADPTINDALLSASAVDTLTRLGRARPFVSTLAEHIRYNGGTSLRYYWPLSDASGPPFLSTGPVVSLSARNPVFTRAASVPGPPGDDVQLLQLDDTGDPFPSDPILTALIGPLTVGSGDALALSVWVRLDSTGDSFGIASLLGNQVLGTYLDGLLIYNDRAGNQAYARGAGTTGTADATYPQPLPVDVWRLVTARVSLPSGVVTLWIGDQFTATATISPAPASIEAAAVFIGDQGGVFARYGHVQVYYGTEASVISYSQHVAQFRQGLTGLERQATGDRIRTIAAYAGVSTAALDSIDDGSTVMQRASLAGKTPLAVMQEAADAERGRLFTAGDGSIVFHDRHRIYNT